MARVPVPSALQIAQESWAQTDNRIVQRSPFTGHTSELELGPAARWTCEAEIVTMTADELLPVRAFLAAMAQLGAWCFVPVYSGGGQALPAGAAAEAAVNGAGQLGQSLIIDGLTAGQTNALAGQKVSIDLEFDEVGVTRRQVAVLLADLVANGSGQGTLQLSTPLRSAPLNNAIVRLSQPAALMRLPNAMRYKNQLAMLHTLPTLMFEENF